MKPSNPAIYWLVSILLSAVAVALIGHEWYRVQRTHADEVVVVKNQTQLEQLLGSRDTVEFAGGREPIRIPTGFFIQSMAFVSPSDVNVTGYVWQKYPADFPGNIKKGFIFPEEVESENTKMDVFYEYTGEQEGKSYQTIGWYFDVTVRQSFDYSKYPLDFLTVWLRLWPQDFTNSEQLLFVPDFAAYSNTERKKFGLDMDIVPGEWNIDETFFSYNNLRYDTNFGYFSDAKDHKFKEFYINLGMRRDFINAFIINLVPLLIVALLLFAQVMTITGRKELSEKFGFNTSGVIATCSALFFVVLLAHVQVRMQFSGSGLVYIEYFYLIMYVVILGVALNAYIFSLGKLKYFNLIYYRDNLIPKVAFWPVVLWTMAVATHLTL